MTVGPASAMGLLGALSHGGRTREGERQIGKRKREGQRKEKRKKERGKKEKLVIFF
jgi:hypothetical protein